MSSIKVFSYFDPWYFPISLYFILFFHSCHYQKPDAIIILAHFDCEHRRKNLQQNNIQRFS